LGKQIYLFSFHLYGGFPEERRTLSLYLKGLSISPATDKSAKKIDKIKSLNLPKNLKFTLPIAKLNISNKNYEGYIMRMMEDMKPISHLMKNSFKNIEECYNYYNQETGGLRRRLEILKKIAYNLYYLHSKGIVYGDISSNNIFISMDSKYTEVWFIDCDNIDYSYDIDYTIGTDGFCSPEIRKVLAPYNMGKQNNTIENDIYAFASLAFNVLFLADPFRGSILLEDNEDDGDDWWDDESNDEKRFDLGKVSWVGENDKSNKPIYGLSTNMDKMISPELKNLRAGQQFYWILDKEDQLEYLNWLVSEKEERIYERTEDGKFKLTETYMAKKEKQFVSEGEIVRGEGGRFSLTDKDGTVRQYELTDNTIAVLNAEGKKAEGELADKYILTKKM